MTEASVGALCVEDFAALKAQLAAWRASGLGVGFVPTMGNLHAGHLALVRACAQQAGVDRVLVSVFVNPTQFGPGEDFARYPRTLEADKAALATVACDALWLPSVSDLYPFGIEAATQLRVPGVSEPLCGACRPGHFDGVASVVLRLLNAVQPDVAAFGEKDRQQLLLIRRLVADLGLSLSLLSVPTVRESDGLAMSSRNRFLDPEMRAIAPHLYEALLRLAHDARSGGDWPQLESQAVRRLEGLGFVMDYLEIRRADLSRPVQGEDLSGCFVFAAAFLGSTRLIDNLALDAALP